MPQGVEVITGLSGIQVKHVEGGEKTLVHADFVGLRVCRHCSSSKVRLKGHYFRDLKHTRSGNRLISIRLRVFKLRCQACHRYSMSQVPGVLPRRRATESFRLEVFEKHQAGHTQLHLSKTHAIGQATVERWYQDFIVYRVKEMSTRPCPRVLGIDEHFFTKKQGFATTFTDLRNGKVFDVTLGRSEISLSRYLSGLKERHRVKIVVIDLSETYRSIIKKYFPNAKIVTDRFHVVRLINYYFQKIWQSLDPKSKNNRGLLSLMRRHPWHLSEDQKSMLQKYLDSIQGLAPIYESRTQLLKLMLLKKLSWSEARQKIHEFLQILSHLTDCPLEALKTLGKTLNSWKEEILRMWRVSWNNGMTEGFHTKMEMISRRAYGFRNFQNYRLRVIALCGWDGLIRRW